MAIGNVALFLAKGTAQGVLGIAFFAVVVGLIVMRDVDISWFEDQTSEGKLAMLSWHASGHFGLCAGTGANCQLL